MKYEIILVFFLQLFTLASCFTNPVIRGENLPDPGAIYYKGVYYVATTGGTTDGGKFAIHSSVDLQTWKYVGAVFASHSIPSWSNASTDFWAPELHIVNGQFRVVFTARETATGILCVGIGVADSVTGPYRDSGAPVIKNTTVGSIDPSILTLDNGTYYLIWKDDGNGKNPQIPTWIKAQLLTSDGLKVKGPQIFLIANTLSWEGDVVEAPWIIKRGDWYYLFYSGHGYCDNSYAVGVARSKNPLGSYQKKGDPILKTNNVWAGPGHCSVLPIPNEDSHVMLYHSWYSGKVCGNNQRVLMASRVYWVNEWPTVPAFASPFNNEKFLF